MSGEIANAVLAQPRAGWVGLIVSDVEYERGKGKRKRRWASA